MELADPSFDGIIINLHGGPHMGRSDFRASETEARQQEAAASKAHTAAQPLAIMMNIADQNPTLTSALALTGYRTIAIARILPC